MHNHYPNALNQVLKISTSSERSLCEILTSVDETTTPSNKKCKTKHDDIEVQNNANVNMTDCGST